MRCHPPSPWDCHSMGQIGVAVSSRYNDEGHCELFCTITFFRPVCRENGQEKVSGTTPFHLWAEIRYGLVCPSSPFLVSKHLLLSGPSFHSAASPWDHPGTVPLLSRQPACGYKYPEKSFYHTCLHAHTHTHTSLMASACRTLADVSVVFPFSSFACGNLTREESISLQPSLPAWHAQTLSSTTAAMTSLG